MVTQNRPPGKDTRGPICQFHIIPVGEPMTPSVYHETMKKGKTPVAA